MAIGPQAVDATSWHDNLVYALLFNAGDVAKGDWRSELVLDIDHIVEWICGTDGGARFRVAPAALTFHDVTDLRVSLDFGGSGHRQLLNELSIAAISQEPIPAPPWHNPTAGGVSSSICPMGVESRLERAATRKHFVPSRWCLTSNIFRRAAGHR